ncbi:ribosomal protein L37AE/L43A [Pseudoxanthomonas japonensis]|uniref:IS1595 family transposase n=1 Tax=Pseudoxanthomonas japonensis TaxID=69284 RepID=UPI00285D1A6F|nr:IS1595 family transposase [Pseudoxanthomonas japonensis]MDR7067485.1 ribosomal protein L37AE/L43A [Pseudoxanthomonas japonensis]
MAQHFLRRSDYRDMSIASISAMSDAEIHSLFCRLRWNSTSHQACPQCGLWEVHYERKSRQQWRCKGCGRDFSVTSATLFASRKKSLRTLLLAVFLYVCSVKGIAGLGMCRLGGYSSKAAHVTTGKLRESILRTQDLTPLRGTVEIDGGYFGGKPRKPNRRGRRNDNVIANRIAGRKKGAKPWHASGMTRLNWNKRKNRRVVMVLRQQGRLGQGAVRSIVAIAQSENERDAAKLISKYVAKGAIIMTDESPAYVGVSLTHEHYAVSHSKEYVTAEGVHENQAESYFSRLRRWEYGVSHGVRPTYLADYAGEMVWREDMRRHTISQQVEAILGKALTIGHSRWWRGYYQGRRRGAEILMNHGLSADARSRMTKS